MAETSCMKETSLHIKNTWIKQLCNGKVRNFAMALRGQKVSGAFKKQASGFHSMSNNREIVKWRHFKKI